MNAKKKGSQGRLPAMAPLANPYVPFQMENPPRYEAGKAIIRGTLYPGLDLPFMGQVNNQPLPDTPKAALQTLAFAIQELALYLDTHRDDKDALEQYRAYQQMYRKCMEAHHRQMTHHHEGREDEYEWLCDPWPWEYAANKEV
ncbi:MAG: spore coat protein CotJB [Oscillospiraceae bacterium]|nr:spore coat protein CotJB [Oscillospiraceae bacterium]